MTDLEFTITTRGRLWYMSLRIVDREHKLVRSADKAMDPKTIEHYKFNLVAQHVRNMAEEVGCPTEAALSHALEAMALLVLKG